MITKTIAARATRRRPDGPAHAPIYQAHISASETIYAGEVIGSGTVGTGCILEHGDGRWLQRGDVVELEVEGIGVLRNPVTAA